MDGLRRPMRIAFLGLVSLWGGCGDQKPPLPRWNEHEPSFAPPAVQSWNRNGSALRARQTPHHYGVDLFLQAGDAAQLEAKFQYGELRLDLQGERVGLFLRPHSGTAWVHAADATTDEDGRVRLPLPEEIRKRGAGTYYVKWVVYGDSTAADAVVRVVQGSAPAVVFDIDGTLTTSDAEMVKDVLADLFRAHYVPRMFDDANKVALQFARLGLEVVYLTARPEWLTDVTRQWLALKGFPLGTVHVNRGNGLALGSAAATSKRDTLRTLSERGAKFAYAFGNATSDIDAYAAAGIPAARTFILGKHGGKGGTIPLAAYRDLYGSVVSSPSNPYRVCLVVVDGLRPDALRVYLERHAPVGSALQRIFGKGVDVQESATVAPSVTMGGHGAIATGRTAGNSGVIANDFFDRKTEKVWALTGGPTNEVDQAIGVYTGRGLANEALRCQTMYEQMSASGKYAVVGTHMFFRGSEYLYPSFFSLLYYLLDARQFDRMATDRLLKRLDGTDTPDLLTIYWPGLDHLSHVDGKTGGVHLDPIELTNTQLRYLRDVIDPEMARLESKLASLGVLRNMVFLLCSDHGHRDVASDDGHSIDLKGEMQRVVEDSPYDDIYNHFLVEGDFDSHAALDGGMARISLRNRATRKWQDAPRFVEDVLPVVGSVQQHRISGKLTCGGEDAVEEILVRKGLEAPYEVVRPTRVRVIIDRVTVLDDRERFGPGEITFEFGANGKVFKQTVPLVLESGATRTFATSFVVDVMPGMDLKVECHGEEDDWWLFDDDMGTARVDITNRAGASQRTFAAKSNTGDFRIAFRTEILPLPTYAYPDLPRWGNLCPLSVLSPAYVQAEERLNAMSDPARSGDIVLLPNMRRGFHFGVKGHPSEHGSLYPEDSLQSFFIGGPPVAKSKVVRGHSGVDVAATVAHILGIDLRGREGVSRVDRESLSELPY